MTRLASAALALLLAGTATLAVAAEPVGADASLPLCVVPRGTAHIDGRLSPGEWAGAAAFPLPCPVDLAKVPWGRLPVVRLMWDRAALYVAVEAPEGPHGPVAERRKRDGPVWMDDAAEVFLSPAGPPVYYQFIVNAAGSRYDGRERNGSWKGDWQAAAGQVGAESGETAARAAGGAVASGRFVCEFAIPWRTLGITAGAGVEPKPGLRLRANFAADCRGLGTVVSWANCGSSLHQPARFGELVLSDAAHGPQVTDLGEPQVRRLRITAGDIGRPYEIKATVKGSGKASGGSWETQVSSSGKGLLKAEWDKPGEAQICVTASTPTGEALLRLPFAVAAVKDFELQPVGLLDIKKVRLRLKYNAPGAKPVAAEVTLRQTGKPARKLTVHFPDGQDATYTDLDLASFGKGKWDLDATLLDAKGVALARAHAVWQTPWWYGSRAGVTDDNWVPAPFTPVEVRGKTVSVWGRTMDFSRGPLPVQIVSRGRPLLAAPISLEAETAAGPIHWKASQARVRRVARGVAVVTGDLTAPGVRVSIHERIEFDGLMWMNMTVAGSRSAELRKLYFVMPLRRARARLMTYQPHLPGFLWTGGKYELNFGAVTAEPWHDTFRQYVWVGDDKRGIEWLCGYPVDWLPKNNPRAVELLPEGAKEVFRARVIDAPTALAKPLRYEFLLQASPVKPRPANWRTIRYRHGAYYGMESQPAGVPASVTYPAAGNLRLDRGSLQLWVVPSFDSEAPSPRNRSLFTVNFPSTNTALSLYWNLDDRGPRAVTMQDGHYTLVSGAHVVTKAGQPVHFAMTWGKALRLYADGKLVLDAHLAGTVKGPLTDARIQLGGDAPGFAVRAIKISDVALPPAALDGEPRADANTLLLDTFDRVDQRGGKTVSVPDVVKGGGVGTVRGPARIAQEGGWRCLRLYKPGVVLDEYAAEKCDFLAYHEDWTPYEGAPYTTYTKKLKSLADACNKRGIGLLLYFDALLADNSPEYRLYGEDWLAKQAPGQPRYVYSRKPAQHDYPVCYCAKSWRDYICANMKRTLDRYNLAGVYSDGLLYVGQCRNTLHGCPADGESVHWRGMEAGRDLAKRVYEIVKSRKRKTYIVMHTELALLPIFSFVDATLDGERFNTIPRSAHFHMPLDAFRAGFTGSAWGPAANFLVYGSPDRAWTDETGLSLTLINDTLQSWSRPWEDKIQDAFDAFGVKEAEWVPYWRSSPWVTVEPATVKVSAYVRRGTGVLLAVSNRSAEPARAKIKLNLARLGLAGGEASAGGGKPLSAWDYLYSRPLTLTGDTLELSMAPYHAALVRVRRGTGEP